MTRWPLKNLQPTRSQCFKPSINRATLITLRRPAQLWSSKPFNYKGELLMKYSLTFMHPNAHDSRESDFYTLEIDAQSAPQSLSDFNGGTAKAYAGYQTSDDKFIIKADPHNDDTIELWGHNTPVWNVWQNTSNLNLGGKVTVNESGKHYSSIEAKITRRSW